MVILVHTQEEQVNEFQDLNKQQTNNRIQSAVLPLMMGHYFRPRALSNIHKCLLSFSASAKMTSMASFPLHHHHFRLPLIHARSFLQSGGLRDSMPINVLPHCHNNMLYSSHTMGGHIFLSSSYHDCISWVRKHCERGGGVLNLLLTIPLHLPPDKYSMKSRGLALTHVPSWAFRSLAAAHHPLCVLCKFRLGTWMTRR